IRRNGRVIRLLAVVTCRGEVRDIRAAENRAIITVLASKIAVAAPTHGNDGSMARCILNAWEKMTEETVRNDDQQYVCTWRNRMDPLDIKTSFRSPTRIIGRNGALGKRLREGRLRRR